MGRMDNVEPVHASSSICSNLPLAVSISGRCDAFDLTMRTRGYARHAVESSSVQYAGSRSVFRTT